MTFNNGSISVSLTKEALIERLESQFVLAEKHDTNMLKIHQAAEKVALKVFRDKCREALTFDYKKAKYANVRLEYNERPECPRSMAVQIRRAIEQIGISAQSRYRISPDSSSPLHTYITWSPNPETPEMC